VWSIPWKTRGGGVLEPKPGDNVAEREGGDDSPNLEGVGGDRIDSGVRRACDASAQNRLVGIHGGKKEKGSFYQ